MIEIEGLWKKFGEKVAVRDLSLLVPKGELFCFLGPNGAGKTTTIKILTGLLRATAGRARICGVDVSSDPLAAKRKVGYIPDMPFLYERLTACEFFRFAADLYDIPASVTVVREGELFELFGLNEYRGSLVKDLSHGYRQRLLYATAFLHDPEVLFIDEPLIGLDPYTIRMIKDLLQAKARAGMTIFLTTHILALAEDIGDRIGVILDGRLCALGSVSELKAAHGGSDLEDVFLRLTGKEGVRGGDVG